MHFQLLYFYNSNTVTIGSMSLICKQKCNWRIARSKALRRWSASQKQTLDWSCWKCSLIWWLNILLFRKVFKKKQKTLCFWNCNSQMSENKNHKSSSFTESLKLVLCTHFSIKSKFLCWLEEINFFFQKKYCLFVVNFFNMRPRGVKNQKIDFFILFIKVPKSTFIRIFFSQKFLKRTKNKRYWYILG